MKKHFKRAYKRIGKEKLKKMLAVFATIALLASSILPYLLV